MKAVKHQSSKMCDYLCEWPPEAFIIYWKALLVHENNFHNIQQSHLCISQISRILLHLCTFHVHCMSQSITVEMTAMACQASQQQSYCVCDCGQTAWWKAISWMHMENNICWNRIARLRFFWFISEQILQAVKVKNILLILTYFVIIQLIICLTGYRNIYLSSLIQQRIQHVIQKHAAIWSHPDTTFYFTSYGYCVGSCRVELED